MPSIGLVSLRLDHVREIGALREAKRLETAPSVMVVDLAKAYEGVEAAGNFRQPRALEDYRAMVLRKSAKQAAFISRHFPNARSLTEPCCGNGRLLIALSSKFDRLEGFDIAATRVAFAREWVQDCGLSNVQVDQADLLGETRPQRATADVVVCITGAFGYFDAAIPNGGHRVTEALANLVRLGGGLILELYQHSRTLRHCRTEPDREWRRWIELPEDDPFRFSLSTFRYDEATRTLYHEKRFVARDGAVDEGRSEAIRIYAPSEIADLLSPWFEDLRLFGDWNDGAFSDDGNLMIVTAHRK